ncbi:MAG: 2-C-methyl-D-erythritol 2,4-cyclodiphosphate synthase [Deltaproteobacteria bacterium]|nr:2-C-methyl-D-erythritol 2,4-cyclodiphosphate synthase [Deltaproteobacteria bacterium]
MFRIGFGYDAHRLVKGRALVIGGVQIPYELGLEGHSDADVLIHSLMDAILGALGKGDIGMHFPDTDPAYKGIDSTLLLKRVMEMADREGYAINNADNTIVAQRPKLSPYMQDMKNRLSRALGVPADRINIKATTTEGMGFCGRDEGIAAYSVVSLASIHK